MAHHQRAADADGVGKWSRAEIEKRYHAHCRQFGCKPYDIDFDPDQRARLWIMPVIRQVIRGIEQNDPACMEIGIELIEEDAKFAFGKIMKANTANALRRANLSELQKQRIRRRVTGLLAKGIVPHEMRQYARLVKRVGLGPYAETLGELTCPWTEIGPAAPYVQRFVRYLLDPKLGPQPK
jgi:hypothetical protein